jgi:hypothetical protein
MNNVSTGFGLCIVGLGIAAWPVLDRLMPQANAVGVGSVAPAVAAAALAQDPPAPTVVWMGVERWGSSLNYHRLWSDGRMEQRCIWQLLNQVPDGTGGCLVQVSFSCYLTPWIEIPPPPGGNGFACRTDLNGDRAVDGVDLGMLLGDWGRFTPCNPEPEYPCVKFGGGWIEPPAQ